MEAQHRAPIEERTDLAPTRARKIAVWSLPLQEGGFPRDIPAQVTLPVACGEIRREIARLASKDQSGEFE